MKLEHIANVEVCDAFSINLVYGESKVRLFHVQVDIRSDGCVCFPVNFFAWWQSSDEIGADDLLGSFGYSDWEHSQLGMRNRLELLILFTASNVLVDEGVHEWLPVILFDEFQSEVVA